ncbi:hypothetical protein ACHAWF_012488, partial [Thalassiosira exigua]
GADASPPYYAADGFCDNDPSKAPGPDDGVALYETAEECCDAVGGSVDGSEEWWKEICLLMTPSPPESVVTGTQSIFAPTTTLPPTVATVVQDEAVKPSTLDPSGAKESGDVVPAPGSLAPTDFLPSLSPIPCDPDPETCGCPDKHMADYRGTISTSATGYPCVEWDGPYVSLDAELEGHNFCRNPTPDFDNRAWCNTEYGYEHCDVPICNAPTASPTASLPPSLSRSPSESPTVSTPPSPSPTPCDSNPDTCGCSDKQMSDYRGSLSMTETGESCVMWDGHYDVTYDAELEGHNFCRNPTPHWLDRAWCYTTSYGGWEYCDVQICGGPTASPTASLRPSSSTGPSVSPSRSALPSLSPTSCDSNPESCGCPDKRMSDYRGSLATTETGESCVMWPEWDAVCHPDAGLEGHNFCRNPFYPNDWDGMLSSDRAWCWTSANDDWGYCDVPICGISGISYPTASPTTSPRPSSSTSPSESPSISSALPSSAPTGLCQMADKTTCGCSNVLYADYRGSIANTESGGPCQMWSQWGIDEGHNFCRNPTPERDFYRAWCYVSQSDWRYCDIPECDACSCMPPCGQPNTESCGCPSVFQAEECCEEGDSTCKCNYLKEACRKGIESGNPDLCQYADATCYCVDDTDPSCGCKMYEDICIEAPSESQGSVCKYAADKCCENMLAAMWSFETSKYCACDLQTSMNMFLGNTSIPPSCNEAQKLIEKEFTAVDEKKSLSALYHLTGGAHWFNNSGWMDGVIFSRLNNESISYCDWYGLKCNDAGRLIEINLSNNNLTGHDPINPQHAYDVGLHGQSFLEPLGVSSVEAIDLSMNKLSGPMYGRSTIVLRKLSHFDLSQNQFSGHVDMIFSPVTSYVNISHNNFTSMRFFRFHATYGALQATFDLSNNRIQGDALANVPPKVKELILSNNRLSGALPRPFPFLETLERLALDGNRLTGPLPNFDASAPRLRKLDLSHQDQMHGGGLTGTIPAALSKLEDLLVLNLAGNKLSESLPADFGNFKQINFLNLSSNELSESIPPELERLQGVLDVLDLSSNNLTGRIPSQLGSFEDTSFRLEGNDLLLPAPLSLCFVPGFDLASDAKYCPPERNVLKVFYDSAKGEDWITNENWKDEYESHCTWYGVECDDESKTTKLELRSNGLSGLLVEDISELSSLKHLDLGDNELKGTIPTSIGLLSNLTFLRLSYNGFVGNETNFGSNLPHLSLLQIHGNRLDGTIPLLNLTFPEGYSFISDCGNPSAFDKSLECLECTMCCNSQGDCYPNTELDIMGFKVCILILPS